MVTEKKIFILWHLPFELFDLYMMLATRTRREKDVNEVERGSNLLCSIVRAKRRERKTAQQPITFAEGWIIQGPRWAAGKCHQPSWARCQVPVTDCQLQLKMISESGVRSSAQCFLPPDWGKNAVTIAGPVIIYSPLYKTLLAPCFYVCFLVLHSRPLASHMQDTCELSESWRLFV